MLPLSATPCALYRNFLIVGVTELLATSIQASLLARNENGPMIKRLRRHSAAYQRVLTGKDRLFHVKNYGAEFFGVPTGVQQPEAILTPAQLGSGEVEIQGILGLRGRAHSAGADHVLAAEKQVIVGLSMLLRKIEQHQH